MAYTTTITNRCYWEHCSRIATHRVHTTAGQPCGDYCKHHADLAQQEQGRWESARENWPHHPTPFSLTPEGNCGVCGYDYDLPTTIHVNTTERPTP